MDGASRKCFWVEADEVIWPITADMIIPQRHREAHAKGFARLLSSGQAQILNKRVEVEGCIRAGHEFPIEVDDFADFARGY